MPMLETDRDRDSRMRSEQSPLASYGNNDPIADGMSNTRRQSMVSNSPYFETRDIIAVTLASIMMLGPLLAYAIGLGG